MKERLPPGADESLNNVVVGEGSGMATQGVTKLSVMLQCRSLAYIRLVWL
jgi:hypothetical protein